MQMAQDAAARRARETARGGRGAKVPEEEEPLVRLWHGRDRLLVGGRHGVAEVRRQIRALAEQQAAGPWRPAAPSGGDSAEELKKLKAQFRAWTKDEAAGELAS